jgi:hypothetical protein
VRTGLHHQRAVLHVAPVLKRVLGAVPRVDAVDRSVQPILGLLCAVLRGRLVGAGPLKLQRHRKSGEQQVHRRLSLDAAARDADEARQLAPA